LVGWVGNALANDMPWRDENIATLNQQLAAYGAPCLGLVPYLADVTPAAAATYLDAAALHQSLMFNTHPAAMPGWAPTHPPVACP
jgi:dethiobiotin synthetase